MRSVKSVFGVVGVLAPILYCGWLLHYFLDLSGSVQEAEAIGLGPTVLGLGVVGLLLSIPLIIKVTRLFARLRVPGSGGTPPSDDGFDADAVIARYKARQVPDSTPSAPPARPTQGGGSPRRSSFGRKTR